MQTRSIGNKIDRIIGGLSNGLVWVAQVVLFLLMLLTAADVIGRFVFKKPITGSLDIIELMMVLLVFLAMGYCTRKRSHVSVDLVTSHLSRHTQAIWDIIASLANVAILALIVWQMGTRAFEQLVSPTGSTTLLLKIPEAPFLLVATAGVLVMCLESIVHAFRSFVQVRDRDK